MPVAFGHDYPDMVEESSHVLLSFDGNQDMAMSSQNWPDWELQDQYLDQHQHQHLHEQLYHHQSSACTMPFDPPFSASLSIRSEHSTFRAILFDAQPIGLDRAPQLTHKNMSTASWTQCMPLDSGPRLTQPSSVTAPLAHPPPSHPSDNQEAFSTFQTDFHEDMDLIHLLMSSTCQTPEYPISDLQPDPGAGQAWTSKLGPCLDARLGPCLDLAPSSAPPFQQQSPAGTKLPLASPASPGGLKRTRSWHGDSEGGVALGPAGQLTYLLASPCVCRPRWQRVSSSTAEQCPPSMCALKPCPGSAPLQNPQVEPVVAAASGGMARVGSIVPTSPQLVWVPPMHALKPKSPPVELVGAEAGHKQHCGIPIPAPHRALQPLLEKAEMSIQAKPKERGRGGRKPAEDPAVLDPTMDPQKAKRIRDNRQSARRSKEKREKEQKELDGNTASSSSCPPASQLVDDGAPLSLPHSFRPSIKKEIPSEPPDLSPEPLPPWAAPPWEPPKRKKSPAARRAVPAHALDLASYSIPENMAVMGVPRAMPHAPSQAPEQSGVPNSRPTGGRKRAPDASLDPKNSPKEAKRINDNRKSAAKSKLNGKAEAKSAGCGQLMLPLALAPTADPA